MKHTKKLVYNKKMGYVPEAELSYTDPLKKEQKDTTDKISSTLKNPKLTQLEKHVKIQSLSRKRRKINKLIENKPIKVILESKQNTETPPSGIEPRQEQRRPNNIQPLIVEQIERQHTPQREIPENAEEEERTVEERREKSKFEEYKGIISDEYYDELVEYVYENRKKFGILETGQIYSNLTTSAHPVPNSRYRDVIGYLTGRNDINANLKHISSLLIRRLLKDREIQNLKTQRGEGKPSIKKPRYVVDLRIKHIKNKKTEGLIRKFRPTLWTKIPV